jgi:hypothetical protein
MISYDNEGIPPKEGKEAIVSSPIADGTPVVVTLGSNAAISSSTSALSIKKSKSNLAINQQQQQINENPNTQSTTSTRTTTNSQGLFRSQFQQKTKYLRDMWSQHQIKITQENGQLFFIILLTVLGIACSMAALISNRWICDGQAR